MPLSLRNCVLWHLLIPAAAFVPSPAWTATHQRLAAISVLRRSNFPARPTMNLFQNMANALKGGGGGAGTAAPASPIFPETVSVPSWESLLSTAQSTEVGKKLTAEKEIREKGLGPTHTDNKVRLFGAKDESEIRVVLYRDTAAWCPYCQKVWLLLEEKQIPFRIEKINMRSYGDKPEWFLQKVPRGLLPAIELDGRSSFLLS